MKLANLSAVVTGAASGLGLGCARQLAARGVSVVIADLSEDEVSAAAALGPQNRFVRADVRDTAQMTEVLDAAERLAPLRVLIHCAGVGGSVRLGEKDGEPGSLEKIETTGRGQPSGTLKNPRPAG